MHITKQAAFIIGILIISQQQAVCVMGRLDSISRRAAYLAESRRKLYNVINPRNAAGASASFALFTQAATQPNNGTVQESTLDQEWNEEKAVFIGLGIGTVTGLVAAGTHFILPYSAALLVSYIAEPMVREAIINTTAQNHNIDKKKLQSAAQLSSWISYLSCPAPRFEKSGGNNNLNNHDHNPRPQAPRPNHHNNEIHLYHGQAHRINEPINPNPEGQPYQGQGQRMNDPINPQS